MVNQGSVPLLEKRTDQEIRFGTKTGSFVTQSTCRLKFVLPAFHNSKEITWDARVDEREQSGSNYDLIVDRDLMQAIGLVLDFDRGVMCWDGAVPYAKIGYLDNSKINVNLFCYFKICELFLISCFHFTLLIMTSKHLTSQPLLTS